MAMNKHAEHIICSAIYYRDGKKYQEQPLNIESGIVIAGRRHNNAFMTLSQLKHDVDSNIIEHSDMGFITSHNRFVGRKEAYIIAKEQGQLLYPDRSKIMTVDEESRCLLFGLEIQSDKSNEILISEDLWYEHD